MKDGIKKYIQNQQFNPGILGIFINPFYIVRKELIRAMVHLANQIHGKTLDIGCGGRPYENIFTHASEYIGMEYDSPENRKRFKKIDVWYDGKYFPFQSESFDSIILTQVLEHVFNPDEFLYQINRVMKKGGMILLSVPFVWDEHEQPHDYARYSSFGLTHLLNKHGFEVVENIKTVPDIRVIFQLIGCYIHKRLARIKPYWPRVFFYIVFISPFTIFGIIISKILPQNKDLYMDNVVLAKKI